MDFVKLFTREETIAGLEIGDAGARLAFIEPPQKAAKPEVLYAAEESFPAGCVSSGVIKNGNAFAEILKNLLKKITAPVRYVVVSIPSDSVYSHVFSFPKSVQSAKLEKTMDLVIGFQLPIQPQEYYLDWEKFDDEGDKNEILLAAARKNVIDDYAKYIEAAGLRLVAIETHALSAVRLADLPKDESVLIKFPNSHGVSFIVFKNKLVKFARFLPNSFVPEKKMNEEIAKTKSFYEADYEPISSVVDLGQLPVSKDIFGKEDFFGKNGNKYMIAVGAALRGIIPRETDDHISLLPVGTEEAYEYQKAAVFAEFLSGITIALSVFFTVVYIGTLAFMNFQQQNIMSRLQNLGSLKFPEDAVNIENRARALNEILEVESRIVSQTPKWSMVFEEIRNRMPSGITISNFNAPSISGTINASGIAKTRTDLNFFKKTMEESPLFGEISIPSTRIDLREDIPFSITFAVKDQSLVMGN